MILTSKQEQGLKIALERYSHNEAWTCIGGYAGSGKSTLVKYIVAALDIDECDVCYVAFTGKASLVLKEKGCPNAMTAHRLLYKSFPRRDGTFAHVPKYPLDRDYKLIIVDEISMLPKVIWDLLLSHHIHVIALGDPGQLPPIGESNGVLDHPHVFLDEIMRQAQESEIIRLTMQIRDKQPLVPFKGKEVQILTKNEVVSGLYTWADQIIAGKNDTRRYINNLMRQYLYETSDPMPIEGDKMICLRNDWDNPSAADDVLVNGLIGSVHNIKELKGLPFIDKAIQADFLPDIYTMLDVEQAPVDLLFRGLRIDQKLITTGEPSINSANFRRVPKNIKPKEFDYGYCITCWKAQGSEYDKVLLFEEDFPYNKEDHIKYLYTGATRARHKLVIIKN